MAIILTALFPFWGGRNCFFVSATSPISIPGLVWNDADCLCIVWKCACDFGLLIGMFWQGYGTFRLRHCLLTHATFWVWIMQTVLLSLEDKHEISFCYFWESYASISTSAKFGGGGCNWLIALSLHD